jgi:hypothetical protein
MRKASGESGLGWAIVTSLGLRRLSQNPSGRLTPSTCTVRRPSRQMGMIRSVTPVHGP